MRAGLIEVRQGDKALPSPRRPDPDGDPTEAEIAEIVAVLRIDRSAILAAQWVDNGPGWIAVLLASAEDVLAVDPVRHHAARIDIGLVGPHAPGSDTAFELRAIFSGPDGGMIEDPVTGSLNASVGQWLFASGRAKAIMSPRRARSSAAPARRCVSGRARPDLVGGRTLTLFRGRLG